MKRALHMLDEFGDIVQGKPRFEITEIARRYLEGPPLGGGPPAFQPAAQCLVDDLAEGPAGTLRFRPELGRDVVIQGQGCPHALMLGSRHHDVNDLPLAPVMRLARSSQLLNDRRPPAATALTPAEPALKSCKAPDSPQPGTHSPCDALALGGRNLAARNRRQNSGQQPLKILDRVQR